MDAITFGYINHKQEVFEKYYRKSLNAVIENSPEYKIDVLSTDSSLVPAKNYNNMIDRCKTKYLLLTHTDVTFGNDLVKRIDETIKQVPNFGALGIVGVSDRHQYFWSKSDGIFTVETLDCCCILINLEHGLRFDEEIFNDYHLYVEDMCIQLKETKGLLCHTILLNAREMSPTIGYDEIAVKDNYFNHHSYTLNQLGGCWGKYREYKERLFHKWGKVIKTT